MATNGKIIDKRWPVLPTPAPEPASALTEAKDHPTPAYTDVTAFMPAMSIETALSRWESIQQFIGRIMVLDEDFGTIPGSKKPSLLKPGAEKLTAFFGLAPTFEVTERTEDWAGDRLGEPFFHYEVKCKLSRDGLVRGEGLGSCNSREVKYRYRDGERKCPACGSAAIIKSKYDDCGWLCFAKKGGCGAKYAVGDPRIEGQQLGRVPNPDVADLVNTLLKMAKKRAHIDAVLNTTGASQFFTQDLEERTEPASGSTSAGFVDDERSAGPDAGLHRIDIGNNPMHSKAAAQYVAANKITELKSRSRKNANPDPLPKPWKTHGEFLALIALLRERVGETRFNEELDLAGVETERDFMNRQDVRGALAFYGRLNTIWEAEQRLQ